MQDRELSGHIFTVQRHTPVWFDLERFESVAKFNDLPNYLEAIKKAKELVPNCRWRVVEDKVASTELSRQLDITMYETVAIHDSEKMKTC